MDSDHSIEQAVGKLLFWGMAASSACFAAGLALAVLEPDGALGADGRRMITAGVALLLLTPAARVGALLAHGIRMRDWDYALIALFVLAMMAAGYASGAG